MGVFECSKRGQGSGHGDKGRLLGLYVRGLLQTLAINLYSWTMKSSFEHLDIHLQLATAVLGILYLHAAERQISGNISHFFIIWVVLPPESATYSHKRGQIEP